MRFQFVDNIRFYSILSIVVFHSCLIFLEFNKNDIVYLSNNKTFILLFIQFLRFGNVCFFMISGFLFGYKMRNSINLKSDVLLYLKKRWQILKIPTLLFSGIMSILSIAIPIAKHFIKGDSINIYTIIYQCFTNYFFGYTWFIYNLFIGFILILLIVLIPRIGYFIFILTFLIAVFWGLNPYLNFINVKEHMFTLLGFSFYIIAGYYLGYYISVFESIIKLIRDYYYIYISLLLLIFIFSYYESLYFYDFTNVLPYYNLKISSQLQSILIFFGFCAFCKKPLYPKYLNPTNETVGLYFIHPIVINFLYYLSFSLFYYFFKIKGKEDIPQIYLPYLLIFSSIIVYFVSLLLVRIIINSNYAKYIGVK